ncbi:unnamed protein product, partial [Protopolystoma xenopodis]
MPIHPYLYLLLSLTNFFIVFLTIGGGISAGSGGGTPERMVERKSSLRMTIKTLPASSSTTLVGGASSGLSGAAQALSSSSSASGIFPPSTSPAGIAGGQNFSTSNANLGSASSVSSSLCSLASAGAPNPSSANGPTTSSYKSGSGITRQHPPVHPASGDSISSTSASKKSRSVDGKPSSYMNQMQQQQQNLCSNPIIPTGPAASGHASGRSTGINNISQTGTSSGGKKERRRRLGHNSLDKMVIISGQAESHSQTPLATQNPILSRQSQNNAFLTTSSSTQSSVLLAGSTSTISSTPAASISLSTGYIAPQGPNSSSSGLPVFSSNATSPLISSAYLAGSINSHTSSPSGSKKKSSLHPTISSSGTSFSPLSTSTSSSLASSIGLGSSTRGMVNSDGVSRKKKKTASNQVGSACNASGGVSASV